MARHACTLGPFGQDHSFATESQTMITRTISLLLFRCRPLAVFRRVSKIIIDALKRQSCGRIAHVGVKVFKTLPAVTDRNAASTIAMKFSIVRIPTTPNHRTPNPVSLSRRHSMSCHDGKSSLSVQAAATDSSSVFKSGAANNRQIAAFAKALAVRETPDHSKIFNHGQATEFLTEKFKSCVRTWDPIRIEFLHAVHAPYLFMNGVEIKPLEMHNHFSGFTIVA